MGKRNPKPRVLWERAHPSHDHDYPPRRSKKRQVTGAAGASRTDLLGRWQGRKWPVAAGGSARITTDEKVTLHKSGFLPCSISPLLRNNPYSTFWGRFHSFICSFISFNSEADVQEGGRESWQEALTSPVGDPDVPYLRGFWSGLQETSALNGQLPWSAYMCTFSILAVYLQLLPWGKFLEMELLTQWIENCTKIYIQKWSSQFYFQWQKRRETWCLPWIGWLNRLWYTLMMGFEMSSGEI